MENSTIWSEAVRNTKIFNVTDECAKFTHNQKAFLQGCKKCNSVTKFELTTERQYIGNVYKTICTCKNCKSTFIQDDQDNDLHNYYNSLKPETDEQKYERILHKSIILGQCTTPAEDDFINSFY